ncbi:hypothetical protein POPTR_010G117951v4 [Populus trichocarpa]|uniref:Auxin-responsive protein n=1 Tax=Populus trichocarpa TaxID=3694 RepID=A0A2K1YST0_POPTR|nr:hypothetical protein POPTR_010G117951v4 [Populus trichocarpa]
MVLWLNTESIWISSLDEQFFVMVAIGHGARATISGHQVNLVIWCRRYSIRLLSRTTINDHGLAVNVQISRNLKTLAYGANPHLILHSVPRSKLCFK